MDNSAVLPNIRIRKITLTDFRNIHHAEIDIPGGKLSEFVNGEGSVLGLYGQNGSGKTSLLMAINALKYALSGESFSFSSFASCIRSGSKHTRLEFEFSAFNEKGVEFDLYYAFSMAIDESETNNRSKAAEDDDNIASIGHRIVFSDTGNNDEGRIIIFDELLQFACQSSDGAKSNKQVLIDASASARKASGKAFGNKIKYEQLTQNCDSNIDDYLNEARLEARIKSTSFIFLPKVVKTLIVGSTMVSHKLILKALSRYGDDYLFVLSVGISAVNNLNVLPLSLWINDEEKGAFGVIFPLRIDKCQILSKHFSLLRNAIESISRVISKIVPNLEIEVIEIGRTISNNGQEVCLIDLLSVRSGLRIPLMYESDGIRRIISFLCFMIAAYNNPSVTIAIDEMDSGIFEYMLGELLSIMKESAKGQLIFTSHNLRPLEVLPYRNLLFTTVNPDNRFAKLDGISGNNNLRDCYFRNIILGKGKDAFYDATDTFNIEQALFEAGLPHEG